VVVWGKSCALNVTPSEEEYGWAPPPRQDAVDAVGVTRQDGSVEEEEDANILVRVDAGG